MSAALKLREKVSVEDYLEGEKTSEVRHEYIGGDIYAMAGASKDHNYISGSIFAALRSHLRGKPCKVFIHDMKAKVWAHLQLFYYPDVMVACDPTDDDLYFISRPRVIIEIISQGPASSSKSSPTARATPTSGRSSSPSCSSLPWRNTCSWNRIS